MIDIIVLVILIAGTFIGLKKGLIKSIVSFFGVIIVLFLAWNLRSILSSFLYSTLPFFSFTGEMALGTIIIYELVSFLIIAIILLILLKLITAFTGLLDMILSFSKSLGFIGKIIGLVLGFIETYFILFIALFILYNFTSLNSQIDESYASKIILNETPILSESVKNESSSIKEISSVKDRFVLGSDEYNKEVFEILLKYKIIDIDTADKLVKENKLVFPNAQDLINKYKN